MASDSQTEDVSYQTLGSPANLPIARWMGQAA